MSLSNQAGHQVPGLTIRSFLARFEIVGDDGKLLWSKERDFTGKEPLAVAEAWTEQVERPAGTKAFRATVRHRFDRGKGWQGQGIVFRAEK